MRFHLTIKSLVLAASVILTSAMWGLLYAADNGSFGAHLAGNYTGKNMLIGAIIGGLIGLFSSFGKKK